MTVDHGENHDDDVGLVQVSLGLSEYMTGQGEEGPAPRLVASSFFFFGNSRHVGRLGVREAGAFDRSFICVYCCVVIRMTEIR